MGFTQEEIQQWNKIATKFGAMARRQMKSKAKGSIAQHLKNRNRKRDGVVEAVGFVFRRHGVFVEMGVFGGLTRKEAIAQGKLNPKPWFNPAVDHHLPKLEKEMLQLMEDFSMNAMRLRIKHTDQ